MAFGAYLTLLGRIGAHKSGYIMVMFPVVALLLSMLFEGLELSASVVIGTALVLVGNLFVMEARMPANHTTAAARRTGWRPRGTAPASAQAKDLP